MPFLRQLHECKRISRNTHKAFQSLGSEPTYCLECGDPQNHLSVVPEVTGLGNRLTLNRQRDKAPRAVSGGQLSSPGGGGHRQGLSLLPATYDDTRGILATREAPLSLGGQGSHRS